MKKVLTKIVLFNNIFLFLPVPATEVAVLKKKMKKRPNFPPNMTVSQLMVQRDRPLNEFKVRH